ncbi:MAG: glutamine-hydrolyzing carbamoyl-phosphate synthase small subunit [Eubacteriales bacterium]|nr:glutamine-hydrolyzing carbamoyl-phosphate synthase small subunit [Eubacteriales bacterium]
MDKKYRKIVLEDGTVFTGVAFGAETEKKVEIVFNTSMVGYQEILSDPSYTGQAVVMTYPMIGNYGMCEEDYETERPSISGMIVREYCDEPSNFRCSKTLNEVMREYDIAGVAGIDTRKLARHIRDYGSCRACIADAERDTELILRELRDWYLEQDFVSKVSTKTPYAFEEEPLGNGPLAADGQPYHVAALDCGIKKNILRDMRRKGLQVTVLPWNTPAEQILELDPDGIFISNGPGDPTDVPETIAAVRQLIGKRPIFGICLGHQILSLAYGAKTYKLKFGHRGGNHPVKDLQTGKLEITSQNHSYAVDADSIKETPLEVTHINLLDNTVEGVRAERDHAFSVQYHPESAPGPQDSGYLFDAFIRDMHKYEEEKTNA